ncbi:MAG TPA: polysaccharide deacetylase family protein, partial [Bacillota bacterium]|nr:polysaccharide deacetylase family protein [Bacillota bacterium]
MNKWLKGLGIGLLVVVIFVTGAWQLSKARRFQLFGEIIPRVNTEEKMVALTIDDGPTKNTGIILDKLKDLGIKATFFVTGEGLKS